MSYGKIWNKVLVNEVTQYYRISFCTTCMNRLYNLKETLPKNIEENNTNLTEERLRLGLKYEIDLSRKLKKELKRIEEALEECQERMTQYNKALYNSRF